MRKMVRGIVGTLFIVGTGKEEPDLVKRVLEKGERGQDAFNAPAKGLFLEKVTYQED